MWQPLLISAGCIPSLILLAAVFLERWRRKRRGERQPLSEKLLRPAGYSLQRKLEDLSDAFDGWLITAFLVSLLAVGVFAATPQDTIGRVMFLIVFGCGSATCTLIAWRKLIQIRGYRLGLLGEQAVAEQLQKLLPLGYQVFHDIPGDGPWNIDHAIVGPGRVFAIETKCRAKKPGQASKLDYEATFDGHRIQFPSGFDADAIEQARRNATWLASVLSKATGERVTVQPMVALPGWKVVLKAKSDVSILSGKQIVGYVSTEPARLSGKLIGQISYQMDQRCRDVEF